LIDEAIENSFALVVIMTPEARASEFVTYEWSYALGRNVNVVPVFLRNAELHPKLAELKYLNFTNRAARPWDKLIQRIREISEGHSPTPIEEINPNVLIFLNDLDNPDAGIRAAAALKLGEIGASVAVPSLIKSLRDSEIKVRFCAVKALGQLADPTTVVHLQLVLSSNETSIRKAAVDALEKIGNDEAISVLLKVLGDSDIGFPAATALGNIGITAIPGLLNALNDDWGWIQRPASKALRLIGEPAVDGLIQILNEGNTQAQEYALEILKDIKTPEAQGEVSKWEAKHLSNPPTVGDIPL
jgi:HEAT repeat protein